MFYLTPGSPKTIVHPYNSINEKVQKVIIKFVFCNFFVTFNAIGNEVSYNMKEAAPFEGTAS